MPELYSFPVCIEKELGSSAPLIPNTPNTCKGELVKEPCFPFQWGLLQWLDGAMASLGQTSLPPRDHPTCTFRCTIHLSEISTMLAWFSARAKGSGAGQMHLLQAQWELNSNARLFQVAFVFQQPCLPILLALNNHFIQLLILCVCWPVLWSGKVVG